MSQDQDDGPASAECEPLPPIHFTCVRPMIGGWVTCEPATGDTLIQPGDVLLPSTPPTPVEMPPKETWHDRPPLL